MGITAARGKLRPTIVEGLFYPAEKGRLRESVERLLSQSPTPRGRSAGVVSPHAGFTYAGAVMASAFRAISERPLRTAVLIGPVHRDPSRAIFLPESEAFATPLGEMRVDTAAVERLLAADPLFVSSDLPHLEEHCLEVQLPFLAHLFPGALIVPLLVGETTLPAIQALARALRLTFDSEPDYTGFVATANMASYMKGTDTAAEAEAFIRLIEDRDWRGIAAAAEGGRTSSCGAAGVAALLCSWGEAARVERLATADSRRVDGDPSRAVHYASFGIGREEPIDHGAGTH
jgi:AmmeMemoRadiSam system protein B